MKILDKLKDRIMPKTEAERQKVKKLAVFTLLSLSCLVCLWLIFLPDGDNGTAHGKANMELPEGSSDGISDTKREAYALDEAQKDKAAQDSTISVLETSLDTVPAAPVMTEQIQSSAEAYRQAQASIQDFYVEDTGTDNVEMDALNERIGTATGATVQRHGDVGTVIPACGAIHGQRQRQCRLSGTATNRGKGQKGCSTRGTGQPQCGVIA